MIDPRKLVKAGVHWGHLTSRWCPRMSPYIWGAKNQVHLIDVFKTAQQIEKASRFIEDLCGRGETILWVGTKRPAQEAIIRAATRLNMPYVNHRWVGGVLSNFHQVKKSVTKLLHLEDVMARANEYPLYSKKDFSSFQKSIDRLEKIVGGIRGLKWPISALVVVDVGREQSALKEAVAMGIPVVAIVDTNCDPSMVDFPIPANDDTPSSIATILDYLTDAAEAGKKRYDVEREKTAAEKKAQQGDNAAFAKNRKPVISRPNVPANDKADETVVDDAVIVMSKDDIEEAPSKRQPLRKPSNAPMAAAARKKKSPMSSASDSAKRPAKKKETAR